MLALGVFIAGIAFVSFCVILAVAATIVLGAIIAFVDERGCTVATGFDVMLLTLNGFVGFVSLAIGLCAVVDVAVGVATVGVVVAVAAIAFDGIGCFGLAAG